TDGAQEPAVTEFDPTTKEEIQSKGNAAVAALSGEVKSFAMAGHPGALAQVDSDNKAVNEQQTKKVSQTESLCIDDLQPRHNTEDFPWSTQCKLFIHFPYGGVYVGSGTLIASKYVITAGFNVYSPSLGGWAESIEVIPGLDGFYKPFGSAWMT